MSSTDKSIERNLRQFFQEKLSPAAQQRQSARRKFPVA